MTDDIIKNGQIKGSIFTTPDDLFKNEKVFLNQGLYLLLFELPYHV